MNIDVLVAVVSKTFDSEIALRTLIRSVNHERNALIFLWGKPRILGNQAM
jgi:hypothetical protein